MMKLDCDGDTTVDEDAVNQMPRQARAAYYAMKAEHASLVRAFETASFARLDELVEKERLANRLQSLIGILPGGVVVLDGNGIVTEVNPAAEELLGEALLGEKWVDIIARVFAPRSDDGFEVSLKDGRRLNIATRSLDNEPGQILLLTDLTETRALQERLNQHKRLTSMGKMTAALAHQVRTPLSAALLYAGHLTNTDMDAQKQQRFAGKLLHQLHSLEQQVKDMLIFAKGGNRILSPVSLDHIYAELYRSLEAQLQQSQSTLTYKNEVGNIKLNCNLESLLGALQNLVNNAIQACEKCAAISFILRRVARTDQIDLIIADKGPGVPAEIKDKVTEPFFTTRSQGTGLGLAVVQAVAKAHHGEIWLESASGSGTQIGIRIPGVMSVAPQEVL